MSGVAVSFLDERRMLDLRPEWLHRFAPTVDVGLSFDCPRCLDINGAREHRLVLWFVSRERRSKDVTQGGAIGRLFDFAGDHWQNLTLWAEQPPPRDPLLRVDHWSGYVSKGQVFDALRMTDL